MAKSKSIKPFLVHLLIILVLAAIVLFVFFSSLKSITRHGQSIQVPDILGQNINTANLKVKQMGLNPIVLDSVFIDSLPALSVVSQTPAGMSKVKKDRIVYLTINRAVPPSVQMPNLVGYSLNSATLLLKSFGLKLGGHSYTANLVKDAVVHQQIGDSDIVAGTKVPMGTTIDLVIGDGSGSQLMSVPDIIGMQLAEARDYVSSMNCSIGAVTPDIDVAHSDSAFIYKQDPANTVTNAQGQTGHVKMKLGGTINVWVSTRPPGGGGGGFAAPPAPAPAQARPQ